MRQRCLRRDQVCVVTGSVFINAADCALVLPEAYTAKYFDSHEKVDKYLAYNHEVVPSAFNERNGIMLLKHLHSAYDHFDWSLYWEDGEDAPRVFVFGQDFHLPGISHGASIIMPRILSPPAPNPRYFVDRFPHKDVINERFRQAVLLRCDTSPDPQVLEYFFEREMDLACVEEDGWEYGSSGDECDPCLWDDLDNLGGRTWFVVHGYFPSGTDLDEHFRAGQGVRKRQGKKKRSNLGGPIAKGSRRSV
ncbi:hypothetical protein HK104_009506 [Borealophlyctis nickersoniae]|nr:hypothetical protein HK104_009506 [Borealophlyctis nickersoniae]